jgi:isocitrate/isopropylmalate dehydrogenase
MTLLLVMEGDGIGPEISAATLAVLRAADRRFGLRLSFTATAVGFPALRECGSTFPQAAYEAARDADGVILGPVSHNDYPRSRRAGLILRVSCANASTCSPTSARRAPAAGFRRAAACRSIW